MSRTCRTCGANATHHALEHIPRQIIDGRGREWNMQDEIRKSYCDQCAPEHAVPATHIGSVARQRDIVEGPGTAQTAPAPSRPLGGPRD